MVTTSNKTAWIGSVSSSPIGVLWFAISDKGLAAITISPEEEKLITQLKAIGFTNIISDPSKITQAAQQVLEYLSRKRTAFDLALDWSGMLPFQLAALKATQSIPYGQTKTYAEIACEIGKPQAARAVGRAEATNPIPLVIPCHRVIGTDGKLHGYGGGKGIETKAWLLALESSE